MNNSTYSAVGTSYGGEEWDEIEAVFAGYYSPSRLFTGSILAICAVLANLIALVSIRYAPNTRRSIYHLTFANLSVANILSVVLIWGSDNTLLFSSKSRNTLFDPAAYCQLQVFLMSPVYLSHSLGTVSSLLMLGLSGLQFISICRPLEQASIVRKHRVLAYIFSVWISTILLGSVPPVWQVILTNSRVCDPELVMRIDRLNKIFVNINVILIFTLHLIIVCMCARIFIEIHKLKKRLSVFHYERDVKQERRAFVTTAVLFIVTMVTFMPYSLLYIASYNGGVRHSATLVLVMNVCPYVKSCFEPLVYGVRTPEVRRGAALLWKRCRDFEGRLRGRESRMSYSNRRNSRPQDTQSFFIQQRSNNITTTAI